MAIKSYNAPDDPISFVMKRDLSGGMDTRKHEQIISDTQATMLKNILLETAGSRTLRSGSTRIDTSYPSSSGEGVGLFGFDPDGGSFELLAVQKTNLSGWNGSGSFTNYKTDLTNDQ
jgi:hypothetical protein